ncbi:ubiquitin carboxyl-terminal hydrolase 9-like isoform X2 [Telopea speciosissima]|uniref:ubiquitin carboxyl-terminal hydrolase 9-like isoform X2 n=1 Tax=Telopea speciosissima TaxID=54955 RepID=UPI001CC68D62|nr:ubiquitin carboxyl-terminal hydrolase 9-like isoform X2 [Telopea speciosissima]
MTIPNFGYLMDNEASCLPCTPEEEKRIIEELTKEAESNLKEGNLYYIISSRWFVEWQRYTGQDTGDSSIDEHPTGSQHSNGFLSKKSERPEQIDNSHLVKSSNDGEIDDLELVRPLEEGRDYVLVAQEVWKKLQEWYKGGPALPRRLISHVVLHQNFTVEVYPLCLHLIDSRDNSQSVIRISKMASVRELYDRVCSFVKLEPEKVRIWDYFNKQKHSLLATSNRTLEEMNLQMDQHILLEVQHNGFWSSGFSMDSTGNELALVPIEPSRSSVTIAGGPTLSNGCSTGFGSSLIQGNNLSSALMDVDDGYGPSSTVRKGDRGGLAGLQNLGNTCFMNSAIQCLVHTSPLVEYFLQDYSEEINKQNPLGMHGELAIGFGDLLRRLWSSGRAPIAPRVFKGKLARFAPQFSGYNQHDSQELLAFLLDGLHEDLNRVKHKPYIETKDANDRPNEEVANECWEYHKARNDSIIVDICQGQYKSTLVCPVCSKVSVTFDPFMYLSLPLPSTLTRTMTIAVFFGDGSALPMSYTVSVLKLGCYKDLTQALSNACCLKSDESILLAEVYDHRIYRYLEKPCDPLSMIKDDECIVAYRLPINHTELSRLEIVHRSKGKATSDPINSKDWKLFGTPLVTCLGEGPQTETDVQIAIHKVLAPLQGKSYFSLTQTHANKENCTALGVDVDRTNSCNPQSALWSQASDNMEVEQTSNGGLSFQLSVSDEKGLSSSPLGNGYLIGPGKSVRVLLDWSGREHDLYDTSFLEDLPEVCKSGFALKNTRQEAISLFSCLEAFLTEEPLGPDDMWYCPSCKEHRQATKKLDLWRLPEILVVHLKRFSYSRYLKNKLDTLVNFPIYNLDLSKYVKSKGAGPQAHVYELYAISNHYGGLGGGHYSAYAKLIDEDRWYHFDDSHVSPVNEDGIKTSAAYVLFYQRVKPKMGAEGSSKVHSPSC